MAGDDDALIGSYWLHAGDTEPLTGREWSPWSFERRVEKLAAVGFEGIGIVDVDLEQALQYEFEDLSAVAAVLEENGMEHVELEMMVNWPLDPEDYRRREERPTRDLLLEAADVLDARHVKVGNTFGHPVPTSVLAERFADLCAEAAAVDTRVGLEIMPADHYVRDLDDALAVVGGPDNGGLLLDSWHMVKMGIENDDIAALDAEDVVSVELADGYVETDLEFLEETLNLRRLPGEGEYDMAGFVEAIRATGYGGPWGLEILSEEYRRLSMDDAYARAYDSGRSVLAD
jgi:sugar phosphate isomerase/epimerase